MNFNLGDLRNMMGSVIENAASRLPQANDGNGASLPMQTITNMLQNIGRGGTGRIDSSALAPLLSQLDTNGDGKVDINDLPENMRGALSQHDMNHDGQVDLSDLQMMLTTLGDQNGDGKIDMMDLPEGARNNLLQAVQGAQGATQTDRATRLAAIQARLSATPAGQQILRGLDTNGDNQLSPQELATAWASLSRLAQNPDTNGDGTLNLDDTPRWVRESLLEYYDTNHDGRLTPADLAPLLGGLNIEETNRQVIASLDTNGDGRVSFDDVPSDLASQLVGALDTNGDGKISLDDLPSGASDRMMQLLDTNNDGNIDANDVPQELGGAAIRALDTNHDGKIDSSDLQALLGSNAALQGLDTNGDGTIDINDLPSDEGRRVVTALLARGDGSLRLSDLPAGTGQAMLSMLDTNGDGSIDIHDVPSRISGAIAAASAAGSAMQDPSIAVTDVPTQAIDGWINNIAAGDEAMSPPSPPLNTPDSGGGGGLVWFLIFLFLALFGGGFWFYKKKKGKLPETRRRLHDDSHFPSELSTPLPAAGLVQEAQAVPPRGDEPVVLAQQVPV